MSYERAPFHTCLRCAAEASYSDSPESKARVIAGCPPHTADERCSAAPAAAPPAAGAAEPLTDAGLKASAKACRAEATRELVRFPVPAANPLADLVARFSHALLEKLEVARLKYGYEADGFLADDWEAHCRFELLRHIDKGDPRDVAAYCAFMWHHGWRSTPTPTIAEVVMANGVPKAEADELKRQLAESEQARFINTGAIQHLRRQLATATQQHREAEARWKQELAEQEVEKLALVVGIKKVHGCLFDVKDSMNATQVARQVRCDLYDLLNGISGAPTAAGEQRGEVAS